MLCFISFMVLLGTVGAIERSTISQTQAIIQLVSSLLVFAISSRKYWTYNEKETQPVKVKRF